MNFLTLGQTLRQKVGMSATGPATMAGQAGVYGRLVLWIGEAWNEIQTAHEDWDWMKTDFTFVPTPPVAGAPSIFTLGTGPGTVGIDPDVFSEWVRDDFRTTVTATGLGSEVPMDFVTYERWFQNYNFGGNRFVTTRPVAIAEGPGKSLCVGPPSDGTYTISGKYWSAPTTMVNDTDLPLGLPARYHWLIVYKAMQKYGSYESAPSVLDEGTVMGDAMMKQLEAWGLPEITAGAAMA